MKEKQKIDGLYAAVILFLICYFMQLYNFQMLWMLAIGSVFCLCYLVKQKVLRINLGTCLLTVTMYAFYIIQYGPRAVVTMIPYVPIVMYVLSNYIGGDIKDSEKRDQKFLGILFALIVGYTIHGLLNSYMYYAGYIKEGTRQWYDFWTRSYMPGPQHNLLYLPVLAAFFPAVIRFRERKIRNLLIIGSSLFFLFTSLVTRSRMSIMIFALVLVGQVILYFLLESRKLKHILTNKKVWCACLGVIILSGVLLFLLKDTSIIKNFVANFSRGGGIFNNIRFKLQRQALSQLFEYPMGGKQMHLAVKYTHMYVHNVWLDMANTSGIIPFFAFVGFTVFSVVTLVRFLLWKGISTEIKLITAGLYGAFFLFYMVEPALEASIHYMTPWMMVNGLMYALMAKDWIVLHGLQNR